MLDVAASCKEESARSLERNIHRERLIKPDSFELRFQPEEKINGLSSCYNVHFCLFPFFFFFKIEERKLHAILRKEDNCILPLG